MALEVHIPKEILEHKDKFFFGLTIRQLVCICIPGIVAACSYYAMYIFNFNKEIITNFISFMFIPFIAFGFFEPQGYKLEEFFKIIYNHRYAQRKKYYATSDNLSNFYIKNIKVKKEYLSEAKDVAVVINFKKNRKEDKQNYKITKKSLKLAIKAAKYSSNLSVSKSQAIETVPASAAAPIPIASIDIPQIKIPVQAPELLELSTELFCKAAEIITESNISKETEIASNNLPVNSTLNSKKLFKSKTKEKRVIQLR